MCFRFASLGSGSRGNATLVEAGATRVLVDCGYPMREFVARCERLGFDPTSLSAILVTHEHGDHMRGVGAVSRRFGIPVWMTHGTWRAADFGSINSLNLFAAHAGVFGIGDLAVTPVPVPHDAREPTQFVFDHRGARLGLLTDLGSITPRVVQAFDGVDALLLECNHDSDMLERGPYPPSLQARVGGRFGHLNNAQAAAFLRSIDHTRLRHLVAAHLSEKNNSPELARRALLGVSECLRDCLSLLMQDEISDWFAIAT
ncbi:MAG: MBL fold metallo-hydrolase [Gammaproteobacteria bacterium]|nr:MBL fold metallo-hydrolase [Gammaproteobacteria bacterium]MCP5298666.1 MBL fold metallo-hydrolase [Chromatiaceae bacterium]